MKKLLIYIFLYLIAINLFAYDLDTNYWNKSDNIWTSKNPIDINELDNFDYYLSKNNRDLIFYNDRVNTIYRFNPENFSIINYSIPSFEKNVYNLFAYSPDEKSILYTLLENNILYIAEYDIQNDSLIQKIAIDSCISQYPVQKFLHLSSLQTVDSSFINISYSIDISDATYPYHNYTNDYDKLMNFKTHNIHLNNYRVFKNGFSEIFYDKVSFSKFPPNKELMIVSFGHSIFDINNNRNYIFSEYNYTYSDKDKLRSNNYSKFNTLHIGFDGTTEKYSLLEIDSTYFSLVGSPKKKLLNRIRELDLKSFETKYYKVSQEQIHKLDYISGAVPNTKVYFKIEDYGLEFISIPSCDILGKINIDTSLIKSFRWLNENWIHYINQEGHSVMININLLELCKNKIIHASKRIATVDENISFSINKIYPNLEYEWIFSDSDTKSTDSFSKSFANEGLYSIKLFIKQNKIVIDSVELKDFIKIINKKNRIIITDEQTNDDYLIHFNYSTSFAPDSIHWYCSSKSDNIQLWESTDNSITKSMYWNDDLQIFLYLFVNKDTFLLEADYSNKTNFNSEVEIIYSQNSIIQDNNSFIDIKYINDNLFTTTCASNISFFQNTSINIYDKIGNFKTKVLEATEIDNPSQFGMQTYFLPILCDSNNNFFTLKKDDYTLYDTKNLQLTDVKITNFYRWNHLLYNEHDYILIVAANILNKIKLPSTNQWSVPIPFKYYNSYTDHITTIKYNNKYVFFGKNEHDSLAMFIVDKDGQLKYSKSITKYKYTFYHPAEVLKNKLYIPISKDSISTYSILIFNLDDYSYKIIALKKNSNMYIKKIKHITFNQTDYFAMSGIYANRNIIRIVDQNLSFVKDFYLPPIVPLNAAIEIPENLFKSTNYFYGYNNNNAWSIGAFIINSPDSIVVSNKVRKLNLKSVIFPNPSNMNFELKIELDSEAIVTLNIYNQMGLLYDTIDNILCSKGKNNINYFFSKELAPGIYFIEIIANNERYFEKLIIQR